MPIPEEILYLTDADVKQTLNVAEAVDLAEKGIRQDASGNVKGDKFYMDVDPNGFIKPFSGYLSGEEFAFVKIFSYFPGNPEKFHHPSTSSVVILFDAETGLPVCMMEASWVTGLKTAAGELCLFKQYWIRWYFFGIAFKNFEVLNSVVSSFEKIPSC